VRAAENFNEGGMLFIFDFLSRLSCAKKEILKKYNIFLICSNNNNHETLKSDVKKRND